MEAGFRIAWKQFSGAHHAQFNQRCECCLRDRTSPRDQVLHEELPRDFQEQTWSTILLRSYTSQAPDSVNYAWSRNTVLEVQVSMADAQMLFFMYYHAVNLHRSEQVTNVPSRVFTALFGSWLGADELCPVAGGAQRRRSSAFLSVTALVHGRGRTWSTSLFMCWLRYKAQRNHHTDTTEIKFENYLEISSLGKAKCKCQITDRHQVPKASPYFKGTPPWVLPGTAGQACPETLWCIPLPPLFNYFIW